jgi:beta-lactamase regulating signal transducer with metallopeptidase domain
MSGLGWVLIQLAVPITFVAAVALVLAQLASRRGPVAASWVLAASLCVIVVVTPLALCGLPQRLSWRMLSLFAAEDVTSIGASLPGRLSSSVAVAAGGASRSVDADSAVSGLDWPGAWWRRLRFSAAREISAIRERTRFLQTAWGAFVLSGAAGCLARLLLGVWGVRNCRRRSHAIDDPDVVAEVESFRLSLSIERPVEVRELSSLIGSTAAVAGWLRPFVLLPRDWRSWSRLERSAVLAHEMAHIGRADYLSGIVAQFGLVLHFYNPLVHWLISRLRLQQELAADALGAPLAGGRRPYLLALSRLALRPEENAFAWPARTFLPAGGHLIRRIQMLKENARGQDRSLSTVAKVVTMTLLIAVGACSVAVRGLAPARGAETPPGATATTELSRQPFDVSYLSPDVMGVYAVRPAAIFRIPGLKRQFETIGAAIAKELPFGLPKLESIEQATVEFKLLSRDLDKKVPGRIVTGDWMVRTVKDFDWKTSIKMLVKDGETPGELIEVHYENRIYYKSIGSAILGPGACFFYFPDARTVVLSLHEDHLRRRIQQGASQRPEFLRGDDWQQVDRAQVAVAIDNRQGRLKLDLASDDPVDLPLAPLLQGARRWVVGFDFAEVLKFRAIATCADDKQGESLARIARVRMAMVQAALDAEIQAGGSDEGIEVASRIAKVLLQACQLHRNGSVVDLSSEGKIETDALAELVQDLTP